MKWVSHWEIKREVMNRFDCVLIKNKKSGRKHKRSYFKSSYYWLNIKTGEMSEWSYPLDMYARCLFGNDAEVIENRRFYDEEEK